MPADPLKLLSDAVTKCIRKSRRFKKELESLQSTLDAVNMCLIQDMEDSNNQLDLSNNIIQRLGENIKKGKRLVDTLERLSMWNIRIWGNWFNCMGPDWAKQLVQLNESFIALIGYIGLESNRNTTHLIILVKALTEKQDELDKKMQRMCSMMEQRMEPRSTVWNDSGGGGSSSGGGGGETSSGGGGGESSSGGGGGSSSGGGGGESSSGGGGGRAAPAPALGLVYQQLFDVAMQLNDKSKMFNFPLERFKSTLQCSQPVIEEITKANWVLHLTEEEEENLTRQLRSGVQLVQKWSKVRKWANYKKKEYTTNIMSLNITLQRLFIRFKLQLERNVKETLDSINKIEAMIKIIEAGCVVQSDDLERKCLGPSDVVRDVQQFNKPVETAVGLNVPSSQGSMDVKTLNSTEIELPAALEFPRDIDKMKVDNIEGSGESPAEPSSPTFGDVTEAGVLKLKQSDKEKWFRRFNSCGERKRKFLSGKRKKGNVILWIIPSYCNKESKMSTFCSCIKPFQKHRETEMIMQAGFPEECIENIIALTTPADACRLSLVSRKFKYAAESDQVWEKFLPSPHLIDAIQSQSTSSFTFVPAKSKKEFYLTLCNNPVLMDNGKMSFSLDKWSGNKCYMVGARELFIVWAGEADKSKYWSWISLAESRFEKVASLNEVCWLEIRGKIDMSILSPWTPYKAYLVYNLTFNAKGFEVPVEVAVVARHYGFEYGSLDAALGKNKQTAYLDPSMKIDGARLPKKRADGWLEMELGEFLCGAEEDGELEMICAEFKDLWWKSGLIVQGMEVRPAIKENFEGEGKGKGKATGSIFRDQGKKAMSQ